MLAVLGLLPGSEGAAPAEVAAAAGALLAELRRLALVRVGLTEDDVAQALERRAQVGWVRTHRVAIKAPLLQGAAWGAGTSGWVCVQVKRPSPARLHM